MSADELAASMRRHPAGKALAGPAASDGTLHPMFLGCPACTRTACPCLDAYADEHPGTTWRQR